MDAFARNELAKFIREYSDCELSSIDDIIVNYMVTVLETLGKNPEDVETSFDVDEFTEMMSEYIPGFNDIDSTVVMEWMFFLSRRFQFGICSDTDVESKPFTGNLNKTPVSIKEDSCLSPKQHENKTVNEESSNCQNESTIPDLMSVNVLGFQGQRDIEIPSLMGVKLSGDYEWPNLFDDGSQDSANCFNAHPVLNMFDVNDQMSSMNINPSAYSCSYVSDEEDNPIINAAVHKQPAQSRKLTNKEKITKLTELFPDIPEGQLQHCLSRAKGNLDKAVRWILSKRENVNIVESSKESHALEEKSTPVVDPTFEAKLSQLREIFPRMSENRLRERLQVVGDNVEKATYILLSEEDNRSICIGTGNKIQTHKVSSKKTNLTDEEKVKLKQETLSKYAFVEDKPDHNYSPVVLVKEESNNKVVPLLDCKDTKVSKVATNPPECKTAVEVKKPRANPKLSKKSRFK